jgi:hypothetical protein
MQEYHLFIICIMKLIQLLSSSEQENAYLLFIKWKLKFDEKNLQEDEGEEE